MNHGGIITGILNEVMLWTVFMEAKKICATWKIEVEFQRPVVCGKIYRASGIIALKPGQKLTEERR